MEAIFSGTVCLCVFRGLAGLEIGAIWELSTPDDAPLPEAQPITVALGGLLGLMGAGVAALFALFHKRVMACFTRWGLLDPRRTIQRALAGSSVMLLIGIFVPRSMFWGEAEFQTIATGAAASELPHVFPTGGAAHLEMYTFWTAMMVGTAKMVAISFTVAAGYRGGFIFPFFAAGAAYGKGLTYVFPALSPIISTLCFACGINVAITRTGLATPLILVALVGEINAMPPVLAASMASLFATSYMPFIRSQVKRADVTHLRSDHMTTGPASMAERSKSYDPEMQQQGSSATSPSSLTPSRAGTPIKVTVKTPRRSDST